MFLLPLHKRTCGVAAANFYVKKEKWRRNVIRLPGYNLSGTITKKWFQLSICFRLALAIRNKHNNILLKQQILPNLILCYRKWSIYKTLGIGLVFSSFREAKETWKKRKGVNNNIVTVRTRWYVGKTKVAMILSGKVKNITN